MNLQRDLSNGLLLLLALLFLLASGGCASPPARKKISLRPPMRIGVIWDDPLRCREAVNAGVRLERDSESLRVGTWNLRWFPDGAPGNEISKYHATDVGWLACTLIYLQYDVVGFQEVKLNKRGRQGMERLVTELNEATEGDWRWVSDGCPNPSAPHVVMLYRADRVRLDQVESHSEIDPTATSSQDSSGCSGRLRPALGAYVTSLRGGVDFHFTSTHLDGGVHTRDFHNRVAAWRSIDQVFSQRFEMTPDSDFVLAADFNQVGSPDCGVVDSGEEHRLLSRIVGALKPDFTLASSPVQCSSYYRGEATFLDQVLVTSAMKEAQGVSQQVIGVCDTRKCRGLTKFEIPALNFLSDHCPIVFDIRDVDLD